MSTTEDRLAADWSVLSVCPECGAKEIVHRSTLVGLPDVGPPDARCCPVCSARANVVVLAGLYTLERVAPQSLVCEGSRRGAMIHDSESLAFLLDSACIALADAIADEVPF